MNEDRFVYVEQDPPLTGEERKRDYHRQRSKWWYHTDPVRREYLKAKLRQYYREGRIGIRARVREYGATLALAVGLLLPAVAQAEDSTPQCPSIRDIAVALKDAAGQAPVASWLNLDGTTMQLFSDPAGNSSTLVLIAGDCAMPVQQGVQLRVYAIVGGDEA